MRHRLLFALLAAFALTACEVPVFPTDDTPAPATRIEGTIEVLVSAGYPYGPAVLFRYSCADPPPPTGAGRPIDFLIVPETEFVEGSAPFVFPSVPPDSCSILGGFLDRDRDFHYAFTTAAQATAGDVSFGFVDVATGSADGDWIEPVLDVELRAETVEPWDRPVFALEDVSEGDDDDSAAPTGPEWPRLVLDGDPEALGRLFTTLQTSPVRTDLGDHDDPRFQVVFAPDLDGDGFPDDFNGDGQYDIVWPQVLFFRLDPEDPTGEAESDPRVVIPGIILPANPFAPLDTSVNLLSQAFDQGVAFDGVSRRAGERLLIVVPALVVTAPAPAPVRTPLEHVQASGVEVTGLYRALVMNPTGQLWFLPNELATDVVTQGGYFSVVAE